MQRRKKSVITTKMMRMRKIALDKYEDKGDSDDSDDDNSSNSETV